MNNVKLLDCTLRDGGYVNDWKWGFEEAKAIINLLVKARTDIIEVGFLRNVEKYDPNISVCNTIEELNKLLPKIYPNNILFSAMAMCSNYDISKLSPYSGKGIEMVRITAHDYDIEDGLAFAKKVQDLGYKVSINPINIMGYNNEEISWIVDMVNKINPYQFSIVDTFGSMKRRDLDRIVTLVNKRLNKNIRLGLHLHENMSLSYCLAQIFADMELDRDITIDGSLMGMGRTPGNLPIELIADYLNDSYNTGYDIDYIMDAIQDYIAPIKGHTEWGYSPAYFLSAKFNLHRNYAEHYLNKGDLTNRDINHILSRFDRSKTTKFDALYADMMYEQYQANIIDDAKDMMALGEIFAGKKVLVIAPGHTIKEYKNKINDFIDKNSIITIAVNFVPSDIKCDYAFFSNQKRYDVYDTTDVKVITTSNVSGDANYCVNYNSLTGAFDAGCNSLIMLLKLLSQLNVDDITMAGADGYTLTGENYYNKKIRSTSSHDSHFNLSVAKAIAKLGVKPKYLTPSLYDIGGEINDK